ncbi:hypothetical protein M2404_003849 [Rheinheimera pacifica]|uniref:hypothetical protein n=1 Tax=Rheinheimera pacifica TaxID=173990 RepID=UPI002167F608|nr:hypothetical protein [Rheinheimera pacifica]MCS4309477.1 hypothetical protein [Rheinheimera pacifica]
MLSYYESAEGLKITKARAVKECEDHGADPAEMFSELGDLAEYDAQAVLRWLGH